MRTLITGLDGFTGCYIKSELEAHGHTVTGLSSDLTDPNAVAVEIGKVRPEAVIHLAGITFVGNGNANAFYEVNLIGTRNLLEALAQQVPNVRSILLASSANVYGNRSEGILSEEAAPDPANDYAVSKFAMEQMARLWIDRLPLFMVRPFNYTGVGQDEAFLIPKIVAHFREKRTAIELGNLEVWREFGDVRTVADIYRRLLEHCPAGDILNICTGQTHSLREVVALCEKITEHSIEIKVNPKFVRTNEVRVLTGDNSHLKRVVGGWQTYDLEETLTWMLTEDEVV
ncbi:MAG: GDP-mannose 4,6-dehydratase [Nitrosomonas sp.]|nr:GDP-mannose 4,6-dehydratase [Nitrosomonas sp.]